MARSLMQAGEKLQRKALAGAGKMRAKISASRGPCETIRERYGIQCNIDGAWKAGEENGGISNWEDAMRSPNIARDWVTGFEIGVANAGS